MRNILTFLLLTLVSAYSIAQQTVPNQVIVKITEDVNIKDLTNKAQSYFGDDSDIRPLKQLSQTMNIWLLAHDADLDSKALVDRLYYYSGVLDAQLNHTVELRETVPNDPQYGTQWQHQNIDSELAWDITTGGLTGLGDSIVVCVIEGGNAEHVDLISNVWKNYNEIPDNGIDDDENGYVDDYDGWNVQSETDAGVYQGGHGTNVMGMIGAQGDNDLGVTGANWNVKIMSVAGESVFDEASLVEAYDYPLNMRLLYEETSGDKGAYVVATNASWGIDGGDAENSPVWCGIYQTLGEEGILNCGATSNSNVDIDQVSDLPTACSSDYMISVTATDINDQRTFSAYGATTVDFGAPGDNIYTTSGNDGYTNTSGTSFASPMTAGVIGLLYSVPCPSLAELSHTNPQAAADLVRQALFDGVDIVDNLIGETVTGGRINAFNSVNLLLASCDADACYAPFSSSQITEDNVSFAVEWSAFNPDHNYGIRYKTTDATEWTQITDLEEPFYNLGELAWCTEYEYQLKTVCAEDLETEWTSSTLILTDGCCVSPALAEITLEVTGESTAEISWPSILAAEQGYNITYSAMGGMSNTLENVQGNSTSLDGLTACTTYDIYVTSACSGGASPEEEMLTFTTLGCGHCTDSEFCFLAMETTEDEWIEEFSIGSYLNPSGDNDGYGDFTGSDITLTRGNTFPLTVIPGYSGNAFSESIRVWIDLDQDGSFEDDEVIAYEGGTNTELISDVLIPLEAELGLTRLRVSMVWANNAPNGGQDPCGEYEYGETEDYCVVIDEFNSVDELSLSSVAMVYPNPVVDQLTIEVLSPELTSVSNMTVTVLDATGREIKRANLIGKSTVLNIESLPAGSYSVRITDNQSVLSVEHIVKM